MTVESNYVIAIATLSDWLKDVRANCLCATLLRR